MNVINQTKTVFFNGQRYVFKYVGNGDWECSSHVDIPDAVVDELEKLLGGIKS